MCEWEAKVMSLRRVVYVDVWCVCEVEREKEGKEVRKGRFDERLYTYGWLRAAGRAAVANGDIFSSGAVRQRWCE